MEELTAQTSEGRTNKSGETNEEISPDTQVEVSKDWLLGCFNSEIFPMNAS